MRSTDGKAIDRVSAERLRALLEQEHAQDFALYKLDGVIGWTEPPAGDAYDGLLAQLE